MPADPMLTRIRALHAATLEQGKLNHGYPSQLKRLVADYARRRRNQGCSWATLAAELPVSSTTARTWMTQADEQAHSLVPVTVIETPQAQIAAQTPDGLILTSPKGYRLSGLSLDQATHLLGHIG